MGDPLYWAMIGFGCIFIVKVGWVLHSFVVGPIKKRERTKEASRIEAEE